MGCRALSSRLSDRCAHQRRGDGHCPRPALPCLADRADAGGTHRGQPTTGRCRRQQQEAEVGAAPARRARAGAAAVLLAVLQRSCEELETEAGVHEGAAQTASTGQSTARGRADTIRGTLGGLKSQEQTLTQQLAAYDRALQSAVDAGHLDADGDLEAVHAECQHTDAQAAHELDTVLPAASRKLAAERTVAEAERSQLLPTIAGLDRTKVALAAERDPLVAEIDALALDPRLTSLAQTDRVDPVAEHRTLIGALAEAIVGADRQRIDLAVADAEDDRAAKALASARGLLPAALDLARAADVLERHRIAATTGWHYLADAVPAGRWADAISCAPHLVGGLLVHDPLDLDEAKTWLDDAGLYPGSTVQVSSTAALQAAIDADHLDTVGFVVTPAPAMFDRTAAAEEAERRNTGRQARGAEVQELEEARDGDVALRNRLLALAKNCPPGHREHLDAEHDRLVVEIAAGELRTAELNVILKGLGERTEALRNTERDLSTRRRLLAGRINVLGNLVERTPDAARMRVELAELPKQRATLDQELADDEGKERAFAATAAREKAEADRKRNSVRSHRTRCEELDGIAAGTAAEVPLPSLAAAQSAYRAANDAYTQQTSGSALEATITEIDNRLTVLGSQLNECGPDERAAADELVKTADAADAAAVRAGTAEAERLRSQAQKDSGLAEAELVTARRELNGHAQTRPATTELMVAVVEPATQDEARQAIEAATAELAIWQGTHQTAGGKAAGFEAQAAAEGRRAEDLAQPAADLVDEDTDDATAGHDDVVAFDGDVAAARDRATAAHKAITVAERAVTAAHGALSERGHQIGRWAAEDRFASVSPEVRDRFRTDNVVDELAPHAEALADQLTVFRHTLSGELAAIDKDKHLVVTALCAEVREALKTLQRAQNHAQLPAGLGDHLANRRFLDVGPRSSVDTSGPVLRSRVERLVDKLVERKEAIPDGMTLAWEATSAAVGRGNFTARVLKPSTASPRNASRWS